MPCTIPEGFQFHIGHLWVKPSEGPGEAFVGITDFAQKQLGKVLFIDLPGLGDAIEAGASFGAVESSKVVTELIAPVSGEVVEVNRALKPSPGLVNDDCYGAGWVAKIRLVDGDDSSGLLSAQAYRSLVGEG